MLVNRYQSLVCAVAYSTCGDLALSEDVAQETFWTAWRGRDIARGSRKVAAVVVWHCPEPRPERPALCGASSRFRREFRRPGRTGDGVPGPDEIAATREEASLVWDTLEQIPDTFREPLILFYRENQSVAQVARALDLSEDAVKQRLSRGRESAPRAGRGTR